MRGKYRPHHILEVVLLFIALACFSASNSKANENSKYLDAVREFADNVLKYGRDTYGPKHTPLFVDGLNVDTLEPVKWIAPNGEKWVLSNLASQQNLFRVLDGLTKMTGDPKYRQAAEEAIKYAFDNLRSPNGLLYWGGRTAYDAKADKICGHYIPHHVLKGNYPYYEMMWEVDPQATRDFIESFWAAHIFNWSNLDMDRIGRLDRPLRVPKGWDQEYKGGPVFFEGGRSFNSAGVDLFRAAAILSKLSAEKEPLIWAKRLAHRYVETRDPKTGISSYIFTIFRNAPKHPLVDDFKGHTVHMGVFFFIPGSGNPVMRQYTLGDWTYSPGVFGDPIFSPFICQLLLGETLGAPGKEFQKWGLEELIALGKTAYRKEDNSWIPMLLDGTSLEGYVCKEDIPEFGLKGDMLKAWKAGLTGFWAYALAYQVTGDKFMWQMARNIASGNNLGDIGAAPKGEPQLNIGTHCSNSHALLGFLSLYERVRKRPFLDMAKRIGDNIQASRFHKGFFVPSGKHVYAKFDAIESLALLHLNAALTPGCPSPPTLWPSRPRFQLHYRSKEEKSCDRVLIYTLTESVEPPISLKEAAFMGNIDLVKSLIAKGIDVNNRGDGTLSTPLHRAAMNGHKDIVELLLDNGADIDARSSATPTALHYAVEKGHKEIAELLIDKGADVNVKNNDGQAPVDIALNRNRNEVVELLIAKGADVSLYVAVRFGALAKVKSLIEEVADINAKDGSGQNALHYAAEIGRKDIAELLIAKGADVNAKDKDGNTPGHVALRENNSAVLDLLIAKGADFTSIHLSAYQGDLDKVRSFIEKETDVSAMDSYGATPLYYAAMRGNKEVVEFLVARGADVNAKNRSGETPLHKAAIAGHKDVVELLIDNAANVNATDQVNYTPLYCAVWSWDTETAELLIEKGADVQVKDRWGWTPLHYAAGGDNRGMAQLLIAKGADVNAKDNSGETALSVAKGKGHTEIAELLRKHGAKE